MEARECILTRRSVRKYKSDVVSDEILQEVMEAALAAPSAVNLQPWHFVVLRSPAVMEEFRGVMREVTKKNHPELAERFAKNPEVIEETEKFMVSLGGAPVCVLAFCLKEYNNRDNALVSVSAAIENLMLAAWDKGLGSCWLAAPVMTGYGPALRDRFAPGKGELVGVVSLGYPDQTPKTPKRKEGRCVFI